MKDLISVKLGAVCVTMVSNIVVNTLVIAVIAKTPTLRDDRTTLFMFSLVVADVVYGVCVMGGSVVMCSLPESPTEIATSIFAFVALWLSLSAFYNVCCVSVCKMIAVVYPLRYLALVTERMCYFVITFNWTASLALAAPLLTVNITWNADMCFFQRRQFDLHDTFYYFAVGLLGGIVPMCVLIYANSRMFVTVVRAVRRIATERFQILGGKNIVISVVQPDPPPILRSIRSSRNIIIICSAYIFAVTPAIIIKTISSVRQIPTASDVEFVFLWLFFCNTSTNGLLYIFLHHSVRIAVKNLLSSCR